MLPPQRNHPRRLHHRLPRRPNRLTSNSSRKFRNWSHMVPFFTAVRSRCSSRRAKRSTRFRASNTSSRSMSFSRYATSDICPCLTTTLTSAKVQCVEHPARHCTRAGFCHHATIRRVWVDRGLHHPPPVALRCFLARYCLRVFHVRLARNIHHDFLPVYSQVY